MQSRCGSLSRPSVASQQFASSFRDGSLMRKPRDIDAELKALADKAKGLKARRIMQLGELVTITGADALDLETLAGALLPAVESAKTSETKEAWRAKGAGFFQGRGRKARGGAAGGECWRRRAHCCGRRQDKPAR